MSKEASQFLNDYVKSAIRTESKDFGGHLRRLTNYCANVELADAAGADIRPILRLLHFFMGLVTEASELLDLLKKHIYYGKPLDPVQVIEEFGDLQWYFAGGMDALFATLTKGNLLQLNAENPGELWAAILERNIDKLRSRYPSKFEAERAIKRDKEAERDALLGGTGNGVALGEG